MPHFKCVPCQARLYRLTFPADLVGELCPGCGSLLEPVDELAEVVGFQSITSRDGADAGGTPGTHERIADRIGDLMARREARLADAGRWLDDSGSFSSEAVAKAIAVPTLKEKPPASPTTARRYSDEAPRSPS